MKKMLSVITVTKNAKIDLLATIESIQSQSVRSKIEYIVIDGDSTDGTKLLLNDKDSLIDSWISESDDGIYSAMNKGLNRATCDWVYFLNSGDVFSSNMVVEHLIEEFFDFDILYSDVYVKDKNRTKIFITSFEKRIINHQGFVYRKELHQQCGPYVSIKGFTAADYLFFLNLNNRSKVKKINEPIAIFKAGGISSSIKAVRQKYCLDYLSGKISTFTFVSMLISYPIYRVIRRLTR